MSETADLIGGLKNAVEHGSTIESAKRSFVNAGYSNEEVEEATKNLGVSNSTMRDNLDMPAVRAVKPLPQEPMIRDNRFFTKKRVLIFAMIALLIIVGALFAGLFFA